MGRGVGFVVSVFSANPDFDNCTHFSQRVQGVIDRGSADLGVYLSYTRIDLIGRWVIIGLSQILAYSLALIGNSMAALLQRIQKTFLFCHYARSALASFTSVLAAFKLE
jgi:hypothetical protein